MSFVPFACRGPTDRIRLCRNDGSHLEVFRAARRSQIAEFGVIAAAIGLR
jgi:hypothetical protein